MASILDAHEIAPNSQKPLILLTFSLWHLNWLHNTKRKPTQLGWFFFLLRCDLNPSTPSDSRRRRREWVSKRKGLSILFAPRYPTKQGAQEASVSSDTARLCDWGGQKQQTAKTRRRHVFTSGVAQSTSFGDKLCLLNKTTCDGDSVYVRTILFSLC